MNVYIDTNIMISLIHDKEDFHLQVMQIFQQKNIHFITSPITILEFNATVLDLWENKILQLEKQTIHELSALSKIQQCQAITDFLSQNIPIDIISTSSIEQFRWKNHSVSIENNLSLAIKLSKQIRLKALDLIQLASALNIKLLTMDSVEYFLTNDKRILKNAQKIHQITRMIAISSQEYIQLLKLDQPS